MSKPGFLMVFLCFLFYQELQAQHTLTDSETEVVNGTIVSCSYDFSVSSIIIPDSLDHQKITGIGDNVFQNIGTNIITAIQLPDGLETIGYEAFQEQHLSTLNLPATITSIGESAFYHNQITSLSIPSGVQSIDKHSFEFNNLNSLTLNEGILNIGDYAFGDNYLTSLNLPNSITNLGSSVFQNNKISSLTLGSGVSQIKSNSFYNNKLTSVDIPEGVTVIESEAFGNNQISSLNLPTSLTNLYEAFNNNAITMLNGQPSQGIIYARNEDGSINNTAIASYGGVANVIDFIPETVTNINGWAFNNNGLTSVILPNNVKSIGDEAFGDNNISQLELNKGLEYIAEKAFYNNNLTSIAIPSTVNYLGGGFVNMNTITTLNGNPTDGIIYALKSGGGIDSTRVISYAGSATQITASILPSNLTTIGLYAFSGSSLTTVEIPSTVTLIENHGFASNSITDITLPDGLVEIDENAFDNNQLSTLVIPNSVTIIKSSAFANNLLTNITLSDALTEINDGVFNNNKLTSFSLPSGIITIGKGAFATNLISTLTLPSNLKIIDNGAFSNNKLTSINIPASVDKIGDKAFEYNQLTSLTLNDGLKIIGASAFINNSLTQADLSLPESVSSIGKNAFTNNTGLDSLYLHQPTVPGFIKWVDGYGIDHNIDTWVTNLTTSYIADVEHTLTDAEIEIVGGIIMSVNYDIRANIITIPRVLQNQVVIGTRESRDDSGNDIGGLFDNRNIKTLNLPGSILQIGEHSFSHNNLTQITFPDSLRYIGYSAFSDNPGLISLVLPNPSNPNFIEWRDNIDVIYPGGTEIFSLNNAYTAQYLYTLTDDDVEVVNGAIVSCSYNFRDKHIIIPDTLDNQAVIAIHGIMKENADGPYIEGVFQSKDLASVQLPATLDSIGMNAFGWNNLKNIVIPDGVKVIDESAFNSNKLSDVTLPDGLKYMGPRAFEWNILKKIKLPAPSNTDFAYWYDSQLNKYNGGDSIDNLNESYTALYKHTLTDDEVVMENGCITSCSYNFDSKYLVIPSTLDGQEVIKINSLILQDQDGNNYIAGMFNNKGLLEIELPATLDTIGEYTFAGNKLSYVNIPAGVKFIDNWAFQNNFLDSLTLPDSIPTKLAVFNSNRLQKLNGKTFDGIFYFVDANGATDSTIIGSYGGNQQIIDFIGPKVKTIYDNAFDGCNITQLEIPENITSINRWAFNWNHLSTLSIPNSVVNIGEGAFVNNTLTEITLPTPQSNNFLFWYDNQNPIVHYQAGQIVTDLYKSYTALIKYTLTDDDVVVENGVITSTSYDNHSAYIVIPDTLDDQPVRSISETWAQSADGPYQKGMFQDNHLIGVDLPSTMDTVGKSAFGWNQIEILNIPLGVKFIESDAFRANQVSNVTVPVSVSYIGNAAFAECDMTEFELPDPDNDDFLYWYDSNNPENHYNGGDTVTDLWTDYTALNKYTLTDDDVVMENEAMISTTFHFQSRYLVIPDTLDGQAVKSIRENWVPDENGSHIRGMFETDGAKKLIGVDLPSTLDSIGSSAFIWNDLTEINFPAGLKAIKGSAFQSNLLTAVNLPNTVTYIGEGAFKDCPLDSIVLPTPETSDFIYWYDNFDPQTRYKGGDIITDFSPSYTALIKYTLTDSDVVVTNGVITASTYDYRSRYIVIPDTLDGQQVVSIGELWKENSDGPYAEGIFQSFGDNYLVGVDLPESLDTIGQAAFEWNRIDEIVLPEGLRYINNTAFQGNQLTTVDIPDSVTFIGSGAFVDCKLTQFNLPNPATDDFVYWYDDNEQPNHFNGGDVVSSLWNSYTALIKYTLTDDDVVVTKGVITASTYDYRSHYIVIPDTLDGQQVVSIGEIWKENSDGPYAEGIFQSFNGKYLVGVDLPKTMDTIGINAFGWNQIENIEIPVGVKCINSSAFADNKISSAVLPDSLRYLGVYAFSDNNLSQLNLPNNPYSNDWIDQNDNVYHNGDIITDFNTWYELVKVNGVNNYVPKTTLSIYPNPVSQFLFIKGDTEEEINISFFNLNGLKVFTKEDQINNTKINLSDFKTGIYLIQATDKNGQMIMNKKFIKK